MDSLNKEELELFYRLDRKKYLVDENQELRTWLEKLKISHQAKDIEDFINKLASWYLVKIPDKLFQSDQELSYDIFKISNSSMTFDNLFNNFTATELNLMNFESLKKPKKEVNELFSQYLLGLAGYKMIYAKNSSPEYGVARAQYMFHEFNEFFDWELNVFMYDDILKRDYSLDNPINIQLLKKLRENKTKNNLKKRKKKLRWFFHS